MAELETQVPTLTLEPTNVSAAANDISLFADAQMPVDEEKLKAEQAAKEAERDRNAIQINEDMLTEQEKAAVEDFYKKIDITDSNMVMQYGAAAQKNIANFSEAALNNVKTKDLGEIGQDLASLVTELKNVGEVEKKGIAGFFQKKKNELDTMKNSYARAEANVDKIVKNLENHQVVLMKDIAMFDQMYDLNMKYYKELTMYIIAGKKRLEQARKEELEELRKKAEASGAQEDAQAYNDFANLCNRFEKKLHDLELTRMISIQMGPQTRLLQNNDTQMLEKIQSSLINTIPLWKSQMVLALGIEHGRQATAAQSAVTQMTNDLLKKNADTLKMATIETAKEAEKSVVDIETLKHTNEQLITTLDEVMKIQTEGAQKRKEAEAELGRIEGELKQKLMELRSN
ncbi:MAG: toxic anion resistance protein [Clostridia bacterium]|nr:toxic anion resistance protein [Clostridia bacterium]